MTQNLPVKASIDWNAIEAEYVTTSITLKELGIKYGIPEYTLWSRSAKYKWAKKRKEFAEKTLQESMNKAAKKRARDLEKSTAQEIEIANGLRFMITAKMKSLVDEETGQCIAEASELNALSSALERAQKVARLALGATTENTEQGGMNIIINNSPDDGEEQGNQPAEAAFSAETDIPTTH